MSTSTNNIMEKIISRIAPTPSGYLHLGNAFNFIYTWREVRKRNGKLLLRIDDVDSTRTRMEYIEDIFDSLSWLGLDWDLGPSGPSDFIKNYSQIKKRDYYFEKMEKIREQTYNCKCSRKAIRELSSTGIYPETCYGANLPFKKGDTAVRLHIPSDQQVKINKQEFDLKQIMGDYILWRKDDLPSYQLVSVVDDCDFKVNLIVRGADLLSSSCTQIHLASLLGGENFDNINFIHHKLITNEGGDKLAKSEGDLSLKFLREKKSSPQFVLKQIAGLMGLDPDGIDSIDDFTLLN